MDERHVIGGVMAGDSAATELFVRQYQRAINRLVRDAGVPTDDVPDVTQEILVEAVRQLSLGQFEQRSTLRTWIRHIARGRIVDYWRSTGRRGLGRTISLETVDVGRSDFLTPAAQEARLLAEEALASMPARHRLAISAHCRMGMPVAELARAFGLSVARTRNIITEAKALFRAHVCGHGKKARR